MKFKVIGYSLVRNLWQKKGKKWLWVSPRMSWSMCYIKRQQKQKPKKPVYTKYTGFGKFLESNSVCNYISWCHTKVTEWNLGKKSSPSSVMTNTPCMSFMLYSLAGAPLLCPCVYCICSAWLLGWLSRQGINAGWPSIGLVSPLLKIRGLSHLIVIKTTLLASLEPTRCVCVYVYVHVCW